MLKLFIIKSFNIKNLLCLFFIFTLFFASANPSGVKISNFNSPIYNELGELVAEIIGYNANVINKNEIQINHVIINVYESNNKIATLYSPSCYTKTNKNEDNISIISSNSEVILQYKSIFLTGSGFKFDINKNYFEVIDDVKLITDPKLISQLNLDL